MKVPAEQIADMRYLYEVQRWPLRKVQARYHVYDPDYVRQVVGYITRRGIAPEALVGELVLVERRKVARRAYRGGGNPSKAHLVVEACFPGTLREIAAAAGLGVMTTHRALKAMQAATPKGAHIAWWRRSKKGNPSAVWCWGDGEDAVCDVEPLAGAVVSRTYRARKKRREAAETERSTERRSVAR